MAVVRARRIVDDAGAAAVLAAAEQAANARNHRVVIAVVDPWGELDGPNGIALSPDERYLYVGNRNLERKLVMRYELDGAGDPVGSGEVLHDMTGAAGDDAIDGIKVDRDGNLFVCGPGGIWVLSPAGEKLGLIELPEDPHNLAWGDADGRAL